MSGATRAYRALWIADVILCVIACVLCWCPTLTQNVLPWWESGSTSMAALATAAFAVLAAIPFATAFLNWSYTLLCIPLSAILFWMCFVGAAEMVSKKRDEMAAQQLAKIESGTTQGADLVALTQQRDALILKLGNKTISPERIASLTTGRDNAETARAAVCDGWRPKEAICAPRTKEKKEAQDRLDDATTILSDTQTLATVRGQIRAQEDAKVNGAVLTVDPMLHASQRITNYLPDKVLGYDIKIKPEELVERRPTDLALTGELLAMWGPKILVALIHGFFSFLRTLLRREGEHLQLATGPAIGPQLPMAVQREARVIPTPEEELPPQKPVRTRTLMMAAPTPKKVSRDEYVAGVLAWLKGVTQTPDGERCTPSALHLVYAKFCEKEGFPVAPVNIFGSIVRTEGKLTTKKTKGQDYFRVSIRGAQLKLVKTDLRTPTPTPSGPTPCGVTPAPTYAVGAP